MGYCVCAIIKMISPKRMGEFASRCLVGFRGDSAKREILNFCDWLMGLGLGIAVMKLYS
jgi:hypothetical protein